MRLALIIFILLSSFLARAQTSELLDPRRSYDVNFNFGTIIPSRLGLDNTVPGWGARVSVPTGKGIFELGGFSAIGNGIIYRTLALDYRLDVEYRPVSAHFLLGVHADQYDATDPVPASSKFAGGWHYGGGITQWLAGPLYLRADFRHRFSPGQVLEVTLGFTYRFASDAR